MPKFCCQPQPTVSEESEQTPGTRRRRNTLILALALTTGPEPLTTLYLLCCLYGHEENTSFTEV